MHKGMTMGDLTEVVEFQHENKRDLIAGTDLLELRLAKDGTHGVEVSTKGGFWYQLSTYAMGQIAAFVHVPLRLVTDMLSVGATENEARAIIRVLEVRLQETGVPRLLRTLTVRGENRKWNKVVIRAFLSDRYRVIDNHEVLETIFGLVKEFKGKLKLESGMVTDNQMYIKLRYPTIRVKIGTTKNKRGLKVDDVVEAGVIITNSEVGDGPLSVRAFIVRCICENGATMSMGTGALSKVHLGRTLTGADSWNSSNAEIMSEMACKIRDTIHNALEFKQKIKAFRRTQQHLISDKHGAVIALSNMMGLTLMEVQYILINPIATRFDLINAVTLAAHMKGITYARGVYLEEVGGKLIEMSPTEWDTIGSAKGVFDV